MTAKSLLEQGSLWVMVAAPVVWATHFLLAYWAAAVWCAKFAADGAGSLFWVRVFVAAITVVALGLIAWIAVHAHVHYEGKLRISDDLVRDTEAERNRFLGHAALLLSTLSAAAVLFDALPLVVFGTCRA